MSKIKIKNKKTGKKIKIKLDEPKIEKVTQIIEKEQKEPRTWKREGYMALSLAIFSVFMTGFLRRWTLDIWNIIMLIIALCSGAAFIYILLNYLKEV